MSKFTQKLKFAPKEPGVYFYKDKSDEIIYIGKAANLKNRVNQYFHTSRLRDAKTDTLVADIADIEWTVVETELDALFLEAELIRRYLPRYNILLRDDKSMVYIRIDIESDYPTVGTTRRPLDDGAKYFGPYLSALSVRQALKVLRRIFPYATRRIPNQKRASLHYHLGLDPGLEDGRTSLNEYRANLRRLIAVIEGKRKSVVKELEKEMKSSAKSKDFEQAAKLRNQINHLNNLNQQVVFSDRENQDLSKDLALVELAKLLNLPKPPRRIEGYDISHMSGTDVVASMVVFTNGASNKSEYRKFKTRKDKNDDFANMHETILRRLHHLPRTARVDNGLGNRMHSSKTYNRYGEREAELATKPSATSADRVYGSARKQVSTARSSGWGMPDLIVIDGGKGQVNAALKATSEAGLEIPLIGLAKRFEQVIVPDGNKSMKIIDLPATSHAIRLLQRIRDESHRFAVSYHSSLKRKRQTASMLDDISGIGPATRKKLIKHFGSLQSVAEAEPEELMQILPAKKVKELKEYLSKQA